MTTRMLIMLLSSIILGAGGQLMFKAAARSLPSVSDAGVLRLVIAMFTTPLVLAGFACFLVSSVLWIAALRSVPLSVAYPMVALSYIIIFTGSYFLFGETLSWRHWLGALLIVMGILLVTWRS